ncbi:MAG: putative acetyltransferase EpsM [Nitrospira sp.]|nr:putative acetyltransferase EpsM [Nitrospira sp.]
MTPLLLIGGGSHCRSCIDVIESTERYEIVGVVEREGGPSALVLGYPVVGSDDEVGELLAQWRTVLVTVGQITSPATRIRLYECALLGGAIFPVIVSTNAYVSQRAEIREGTIVMHGATVNTGARIGVNCIVNSQALVEHDAVVGAHSHIATGARVNGGVTIGEGSFVGSGAIVNQGVTIGAGCLIASGSIIGQDVPPGTQVRRDG